MAMTERNIDWDFLWLMVAGNILQLQDPIKRPSKEYYQAAKAMRDEWAANGYPLTPETFPLIVTNLAEQLGGLNAEGFAAALEVLKERGLDLQVPGLDHAQIAQELGQVVKPN
jgi:hypothetical protein